MSALQAGESGQYGELVRRPPPEGLALVFVPSLAALLIRAQQLNGAALTEPQVLRIRDGAKVAVVRHDDARAGTEKKEATPTLMPPTPGAAGCSYETRKREHLRAPRPHRIGSAGTTRSIRHIPERRLGSASSITTR
jgi:hypothetical protein